MRTPRLILATAALSLLGTATSGAAVLPPILVLEDGRFDNFTAENDTPLGAATDLVAGYIAETDASIDFTWELADLEPLLVPTVPINAIYYWEFELTNPDGATSAFSVRARMFPLPVSTANPTATPNPSYPTGQLQSNCVTANNVVTCRPVAGAVVTVTVDAENDQVTASVRRQDLKAADGAELAVDGAKLAQVTLFDGVSSCFSFVAVSSAAACDPGSMHLIYTLGEPDQG